ncbi:MAG: hypothetical protein ACRD4J_07060 [Nitrososphaeraceae archaeon]
MGSNTSDQTLLVLYVIAVLLIPSIIAIPLYAQELRTEDYIITDFGLRNGNTPFISVQGKAGGSYDASLGDEGYEAYVFKTDKGNFMITIAEGSGTNPYYSTNHLLTNDVKLNECLDTESGRGKPSFHEHTAEYQGRNLNFTAITHVYAIQVTSDDPDEECETGEHVSKIFSQMTK